MTTTIRQEDLVESIADALQYISYFHPVDFIRALHEAYQKEANPAARDAMAQILINSRMCAQGRRPICQDTGIVTVFMQVGMDVRWQGEMSVEEMVNEGVRRAYLHPDNTLRASILEDPDGSRRNTGDNTPCVIHYELVPGDRLEVHVAASDSVVDWVLQMVPAMGAGWCPPGMLGVGIGGTAEKAMLLAKQALLDPIDIQALKERGASNRAEELRLELYDRINQLGIGAQGLGGLTTVLDVKVRDYATHAANKAVAVIPNCAATRHVHFALDGTGPARIQPPSLDDWPEVTREVGEGVRRVDLNTVTRDEIAGWKPGDVLLLNGKMLTGRDAAHKKMIDLLAAGQKLPVDLNGRFIYYVGPVDPVRDEVVGPAGPTTATRMDKFTRTLLEQTGLVGMVGKAERGPAAIEAIRDHRAVYLMAVGGAAYLVAQAIKSSEVLAFPELGMEAIYEFEVEDMPVTVAVDVNGESVHQTGPEVWRARIVDSLAQG
jgi:fumarate hydratase class I